MSAVAYHAPPSLGTLTIKEWPVCDRPRERLRTLGARALAPRELLALLVETGTPGADGRPARSAMDLAGDLLHWAQRGRDHTDRQPLSRIMNASFASLCTVPGIGPAKAAKILAALELGRRAGAEGRSDRHRFSCARDVFEHMRGALCHLPQEECHVLLLNAQRELTRDVVVARGTVDGCAVHARDIFREALLDSAHSVVLVHNHPSGETTPSTEDIALTRHMMGASHLLGITLLDHIVVGDGRYTSFSEERILLKSGW